MGDKVIPPRFVPDAGGETVERGGERFYLQNDAMHVFYRRSLGELTPFFLGLRDEKAVYGARCTRCGIVRVPPMARRCPDCDFAPMEPVKVGDTGIMGNTPPITYFANALFQEQVPFGRGRVILDGADTALSVNVYTTGGILVPGKIRKGCRMKVVFRDRRKAEICDIFCVPAEELTPEQIARPGLLESEIRWRGSREPSLPPAGPEGRARLEEAVETLRGLASEIRACPRARQDIEGWRRRILVRTAGGELGLVIDDGDFRVEDGPPENPDLSFVVEDPEILVAGLGYRGSLTQEIIRGRLWIDQNSEFTTVFKLERMARSLARSKRGGG
jgi:uncharacterized OB-fold protein